MVDCCFCFFYFQFFNPFWKNTRGIVFSTMYIFAYQPPSVTHRDEKITFGHCFLWENLLFRQNNYLFNNFHPIWIMTNKVTFPKKNTFLGKYHCQTFSKHIANFHPKLKKNIGVSFIWKLKAKRFQNTLDLHYNQRIWGRNDFSNLDNAVYLPPKNALFAPLLDIKPFLTMTKIKHCLKWPTILEWYDQDSLLSLVWGCQHI